ncbi:ligand-binding sensor domain-containing protein [Algoriphagus hitonicola]|uniref:ligand-binding sensor domain-containing protein n=1 Tax=Algoriphagus hitonicola TaxID=435880 RepID=UPI000B83721D|nr:two-component regulator propeller domain-containing protein [Algoriphagus hitonicola]
MLLLVFYSIPNFWDTGYSFAQAEQNSDSAADFSLDYVMEIWDNTKGLPQNAVFALEKDNHGYLWIATEEGLVRFDGTYPKVFDQDNYPEMIEQTYYTFFKTPGGLWATADRSVALLEKNIQKVIDCTSITENTWIRAITQIENGDLLIGTEEGKIHRWANETFTPLDFWNPELGLEIQSFFHWSPSQLMVGTTRGLYLLDLDAEEVKLLSSDTFPVIKIFGSSSVVYVYSPDAGIFQLMENMEMKSIISFNEINDINPSSLVSDSENRIWAGSIEKGIILIENGKVNRFSYPELENYTIRKIIKEDENLYLGTLGKGLALVKPAKVTQPKFKALDKKNIKPIFQAADSSVWIGTRSDGIFWIEDGKIRNLNESNGLIQNGITTIGAKDEKIYAGTTVGISIIDRNSGKIISEFTKEDGLKHNYITAIYKDSKDWVWILTRRGGIHYIDENEVFHQIDLPENFAFTNFVTIKELRNKEILIGSMNQGIFRFKDGEFIGNRTLPLTPGEDVVYAIYEDKVGDLWFATHGGLILLKDGRFKVLRKANGLKTKSVYSITHDGINGVWISNNFGVQYFSDSELEKFKETRDEDFFIGTTLYNESLGMPNSEANGLIFPPVTKDFSGKIWVPTVEGVGVIDPAVTSEQAKSPSNFIWDELQLGNQKAAIDSQIEIPPGVRMFQVSFSLIDFENPSQYSLFYRIDDGSESWLPIKDQRLLFFNGLMPGTYDLEVKILRFGQEETIHSLPIQVKANFIETPFFWMIIGFSLLLLVYFIFRYYFNSKMKRELEAKVERRTLQLSQTNEKLKEAVREIEDQNLRLQEITWDQSHLVRAPLTKAMGINQLLIKYSKYSKVAKSKEELEIELLETLKQLDEIVKETHSKSENLKK